MRCDCNGFSLLTFLIYFLCIQLLVVMTFQYSNFVCSRLITGEFFAHATTKIYAAHDFFVRDIWMAPSNKKEWKKITEHELIWKKGDKDIGWRWIDNKLFRLEGTYDRKKDIWHINACSLVMHRNGSSFSVSLCRDNVIAVKITSTIHIANKECTLYREATVRNRVLL